jgi:membrane protein implicated in regulation of membrane protease activity
MCIVFASVERPKAPGLAALAIGLLTIFLAGILLDGLLLLPFWFLAAVGLSKLLRRRGREDCGEHF